jgi:protoporphyrinogen IX oxidase
MDLYLLTKFFHIAGIVVWIGTLLNTSRLLVFHSSEEVDTQKRLSLFERKSYMIAQVPGMILTVVTGFIMIFMNPFIMKGGWFHAKFLLVLVLILIDFFVGKSLRKFIEEPGKQEEKKYKIFHMISAFCFLLAAFLAVIKPF